MRNALIVGLLILSSPFARAANSLTTVVQNDEHESLLADVYKRTLYVFDVDIGTTSSSCSSDCAEVWPPYILSDTEAASVVSPLGVIARANKKVQLTYNGRPVYTYAFDRVEGDDQGDGIGGVWHYIETK